MKHRAFFLLFVLLSVLAVAGCKKDKPAVQTASVDNNKGETDKPGSGADVAVEQQADRKADAGTAPPAAKADVRPEVARDKPDPEIEISAKRYERLKEARARLAKVTGLLGEAKTDWQVARDADKIGLMDTFLMQTVQLDKDLQLAQEVLAKGHVELADMKLTVVETQLETLEARALDRPDVLAPSDEEMKAMLNILAEETCLVRKQLPVKSFREERVKLFEKYQLGRAQYERLRTIHNREPKAEYQLLLGDLISKACPVPGADKEEAVEPEDPGPAVTGRFAGEFKTPDKAGTIEFEVKNGNVSGGFLRFDGALFTLRGGVRKNVLLVGRTADAKNHTKCTGANVAGKLSGTCSGALGTRRFEGPFFAREAAKP